MSSTSTHPPQDTSNAAPQGQPAAATAAAAELADSKIRLKAGLRQYPDFPSPGILFEDICPLFANPDLHSLLIKTLASFVSAANGGPGKPDIIVGLDARGFLFGPSLALQFGAGFVPVRKPGKLPGKTVTAKYQKEYGADVFELQEDAIKPGQKVLVVDDIIATGGSASAAGELVEKVGGQLIGYVFLLELLFLKGRDKLKAPVYTLLSGQEG